MAKGDRMYVEDKQTGEKFDVEINRVKPKEFSVLKKNKQFKFDWYRYKDQEVYKLCFEGTNDILGLMRIIDHSEPGYDYLEVDVIEIAKDNQGKEKGLSRIGGCLLGYAALLADEYNHDGYVGLVAKNNKAPLFHNKFGFEYIGSIAVFGERMVSDTSNSIKLVKEYIDKKISNETK